MMQLISTIGAASYGFLIFPKMLEYQTNKASIMNDIFLWMSFMFILLGNYQNRVKAGSAFNGLMVHIYSENLQTKINRYQAKAFMILGVIGVLVFSFFDEKLINKYSMFYFTGMILATIGSTCYAIFSTPAIERFSTTEKGAIGPAEQRMNTAGKGIAVLMVGLLIAKVFFHYQIPTFAYGFFGGLAVVYSIMFLSKRKR